MRYGTWVDDIMVSRPRPSKAARAKHGSMQQWVMNCVR